MAARYKKILKKKYTKKLYTDNKNPMLVIGVNKRNKQWRVHQSYLSTEPVLPISNLSLKTISFTQFTNNINITALHMKYFRQSTEPGRFKPYDSRVAKLKAFSGIQQMWFTKRID